MTRQFGDLADRGGPFSFCSRETTGSNNHPAEGQLGKLMAMQRVLLFVALAAIALALTGVLDPQPFRAGQVIRFADGSKWTLVAPNDEYPGMWWIQTAATIPDVFSIDEEDLSAALRGEFPPRSTPVFAPRPGIDFSVEATTASRIE